MKSTIQFFVTIGIVLLLFNLFVVPLFQNKVRGVVAQKSASITMGMNSTVNLYEEGMLVLEKERKRKTINAYNKAGGNLLWQQEIPVALNIQVDENYFLVYNFKAELALINAKNGKENWKTKIPFREEEVLNERPEIMTSASKVLLFCKQGNNNLLIFINGKDGGIEHKHKFQFDYYRGSKLIDIVELFNKNIDWTAWSYFKAINMLYNAKTKEVIFLTKNDIWQTPDALWAIVDEGELKKKIYKLSTSQNGFLTFKQIPEVSTVVSGENYLAMLYERNNNETIVRVFKTTNLGKVIFETQIETNTQPIIQKHCLAYFNTKEQLVIRNLKEEQNQLINRDFDFLIKDVFLDVENVYVREKKNKEHLLHIVPLDFSPLTN